MKTIITLILMVVIIFLSLRFWLNRLNQIVEQEDDPYIQDAYESKQNVDEWRDVPANAKM